MLEHLGQLRAQRNYNLTRLYFERLLPAYTLNAQLWRLYIELTIDQNQDKNVHANVHVRCLKNLYADAEIWCSYVQTLEQIKTPV